MIRNAVTRGLLAVLVLFSADTNDSSALRRTSAARTLDKLASVPVVLKVSIVNEDSVPVIPDLRVESFEIEENGVKQKAAGFIREQRPISLLLMIDSSGSMRPVIQMIVDALSKAVKQLKSDDEVALMSFNNRADLYQTFTRNKELVAEKIRLVLARRPTLTGQALLEAANYMCDASLNDNRRIILVLTDNRPSMPGDTIPGKTVMQKVSESDSVVCGIVVAYPPLDESRRKARSASDVIPYVSETGGLIANMKSLDPAAISKAFLKVIDSFREYYRIEYYPTDSRLDGKHRKIKIKLSGDAQRAVGKARLLSRQGYYARDISVIQQPK